MAAARVVNALMALYVEQELEAKRHSMAEASNQLRRQGEALYADLEATWARIRQLENSGSMVTTLAGTVISQRLVALAEEEQNVNNEWARARADLEQILSRRAKWPRQPSEPSAGHAAAQGTP